MLGTAPHTVKPRSRAAVDKRRAVAEYGIMRALLQAGAS